MRTFAEFSSVTEQRPQVLKNNNTFLLHHHPPQSFPTTSFQKKNNMGAGCSTDAGPGANNNGTAPTTQRDLGADMDCLEHHDATSGNHAASSSSSAAATSAAPFIKAPSNTSNHLPPLKVAPLPSIPAAAATFAPTVTASIKNNPAAWPAATLNALNTHFRGWKTTQDVQDVVKRELQRLSFTPENTLFAHSTCPDEINHEEDDVTQRMCRDWGEVFHLGGLAGLPFAGKTGFNAYSHHVPKDGHLLVLFAPHVGIALDGTIGRYRRPGQNHDSTACGAAVGAWNAIKTATQEKLEEISKSHDEADFQMQYIMRQMVTKYLPRLRAAAEVSGDSSSSNHTHANFPPAAAHADGHGGHGGSNDGHNNNEQAVLSMVMFDMVHHLIKQVVHTKFGGSLALIGGVQINVSDTMAADAFLPLAFYVLREGQEPLDLLAAFH